MYKIIILLLLLTTSLKAQVFQPFEADHSALDNVSNLVVDSNLIYYTDYKLTMDTTYNIYRSEHYIHKMNGISKTQQSVKIPLDTSQIIYLHQQLELVNDTFYTFAFYGGTNSISFNTRTFSELHLLCLDTNLNLIRNTHLATFPQAKPSIFKFLNDSIMLYSMYDNNTNYINSHYFINVYQNTHNNFYTSSPQSYYNGWLKTNDTTSYLRIVVKRRIRL